MSVRDPEVLEALREEPELLAIADAVVETLSYRRRRSRLGALAVLAAVVAGVVALVLATPWERGGNCRGPVLACARAAVLTSRPVLHSTARYSNFLQRVDLATGETAKVETVADLWYDTKRNVARVRIRHDGVTAVDETGSGSGAGPETAEAEMIVNADARYREALVSGKAKVVGQGTWLGHDVYWIAPLASDLGEVVGRGTLFGVDRHSYDLVAMRFPQGSTPESVSIEYVSRGDADFGQVSSTFLEGGGGMDLPLPASPAAAQAERLSLGVPAVWAGPELDGLPLNGLAAGEAQVEPPSGPRGKVITLVYGGRESTLPGSFGGGVWVRQMRINSPAWKAVDALEPPGTGIAHLYEQSVDDDFILKRWNAVLAVGDVWVWVGAPTRKLAIDAARALTPIPPG